jgi:mono/diheme cytochrome c family protein
MTRSLVFVVSLLALPATLYAADPSGPSADDVERGKYLVTLGGCGDCHTPWKMGAKGPEPDMSRMLSGHPQAMKVTGPAKGLKEPWGWAGTNSMTAFSGPWGVSFAANLTPDETGLGSWSEKDFVAAVREGKHKGTGRAILPPMPWPNVAKASDDDLRAIWAFLRSIPPVKNQVAMPIAPEKGKQATR